MLLIFIFKIFFKDDENEIFNEMRNGSLKLFVNEILKYHESKALRSFRNYNEISFYSVVEVMLRNFSIQYISELQLIMKYKEKEKEITYGFSDLFLIDKKLGQDFILIELKLFNLIGLYSGDLNKNNPIWVDHLEYNDLADFDKKVQEESEELLRNRYYIYWSKKEGHYKSMKIKSIIDSGYEQLCRYIKVIVKGKVHNKLV